MTYLDIIPEHADSRETIFKVLMSLEEKYQCIRGQSEHLVVVGDAKIYTHLESLKEEYGDDLKWMLPMPGDWRILKNFKPVIQKIFFEAGLKQLAQASGFCSATPTALSNASNFHITHSFVLQAYEAIYRVMLEVFLSSNPALAPLVQEFSDGVHRQGNIPDSITETIVDLSECTEQLRKVVTSFVIHSFFGVVSYSKML